MQMKYYLGLFLFTSSASILSIQAENLKISAFSLGIGDWIDISDDNWENREDYGTLPAATLYWTGWGWNGSLGVPFKSSFKRVEHKTRYSLGNGEVSLGKRIGTLSPRLSLKFPLYNWSVKDPSENEFFIGSGTWDLALGLNGRLPKPFVPRGFTIQYDLEAATVLVAGLADYGTYHGQGVLQASYALGSRWKAGITGLFLLDHWIWIPDYWDQKGETKFSIVPGALIGVRIFQATYVDAKAGLSIYEYRKLIEPKYRGLGHDSYHFGLSVYQAFK